MNMCHFVYTVYFDACGKMQEDIDFCIVRSDKLVHDCAATVAASRGHERSEMLPVAAQNDALRTFPCGVMEREICASGNCTKPNKN